MKRQQVGLFAAHILGCATIAGCFLLSVVSPADAVVVSDNFDTPHDYQFVLLPAGGIWNGMENVLNLNGGVFNASTSNAGTLTVEDNGTFVAASGPPGMGWEGGRSTAPFLFTNVPAGQDFTASVKISAQTSGQWSAAGIIARAANSPTPPGVGADHTDENFVTATTFRTNAGIPDVGTTLNKRIENGAQVNDTQINVNNPSNVPNPVPPPDTVSVPLNPLPTYVRLERVGGGTAYRTWVSSDGTNWQFQSRVIPTAGNPLADPVVPMQVGLSYMNFGTLAGTTQFDDFVLDTYAPLEAPGAPNISATQTSFTVPRGTVLTQLITNSTANQGPLNWVRTPNSPGADAVLPGAQGGPPSALTPVPPPNGSYFRWDTLAPVGSYMVTVTATHDWGQASNALVLTINIIPEPATMAMAGLAITGLLAMLRRRR
jgi:hypothetical protein